MDELLQETEEKGRADTPGTGEVKALCRLLEEHKAVNVTALDLRKLNLWTDFFVIATVTSSTHLLGLLRHIKEYADEQGLSIRRQTQKGRNAPAGGPDGIPGGGWDLVDMGTAVIHLMTAQSREFYELEVLWGSAGRVYPP